MLNTARSKVRILIIYKVLDLFQNKNFKVKHLPKKYFYFHFPIFNRYCSSLNRCMQNKFNDSEHLLQGNSLKQDIFPLTASCLIDPIGAGKFVMATLRR